MSGEAVDSFDCFGSRCGARVIGPALGRSAEDAVELIRRRLLSWHRRFSRFRPDSELARLNRDPRERVTVSPLMARLVEAAVHAGSLTGGLVDATLLEEIVLAGYATDLGDPLPLANALRLAPPRQPATPSPASGWRQLALDPVSRSLTRPPGLALDSGGLAKGLFADVLSEGLAGHEAFAIDCGGDIMIGGRGCVPRPIRVESPFERRLLHTFEVSRGAVATSGIGRRSWLDGAGRPAHHLLDPGSGRPAFTGVVQATALAPSAVEAEVRAKAAVLAGPERAPRWLPHGGVIVLDDATHQVLEQPPVVTLRRPTPQDVRADPPQAA